MKVSDAKKILKKIWGYDSFLEHQEEELDVYDDYEEKKPEEYEEKEKVTTVAVDKFLDGDVKWKKIQLEP